MSRTRCEETRYGKVEEHLKAVDQRQEDGRTHTPPCEIGLQGVVVVVILGIKPLCNHSATY